MTNRKQLTKANSTKAQRRAANGLPPKRPRNPIPRPIAMRSSQPSPYIQCISGPVNMPSMSSGFPDGDATPSVTMDYRMVYTIRPSSSGELKFMILPCYQGAFSKLFGLMNSTNQVVIKSPSHVNGYAVTAQAESTSHMGVPWMTTSGTSLFGTDLTKPYNSFRPIVVAADIEFTGNSMYNGGNVAITKVLTRPAEQKAEEYTYSATEKALVPLHSYPTLYSTSRTLLPSSVVGPARESYHTRIVPTDGEYQPIAPCLVDQPHFASYTAESGPVPSALPYQNAHGVLYQYSGLDSSATITVSIRYCVQYTVGGTSSLAPLAKPSPPSQPSLWNRVTSYVANMPVAQAVVKTAAQAAFTAGYRALPPPAQLAIASVAHNMS